MTRKFIENAAKETGWNCSISKRKNTGYDINFQMFTNLGQDVNEDFYVKKLNDLPSKVYERYQNYDPNEETALWIGPDGHGKNGAPHDMEDILDDMKKVEKSLEKLYDTLNGRHLPDPNKVDFARKAANLRQECLQTLLSNWHRAKPSRFGIDAKGFANPNRCSLYEEINYLYGMWTLFDGNGFQYDINSMPLEEFCQMVDNIINEKK